MTTPSEEPQAQPAAPAGWYPAQGDPPGTVRYWDGTQWVGGPITPAAPAAEPAPPAPEALRLATPWTRIGARVIDFLIILVPTIAVLAGTGYGSPDDLETLGGTQILAIFMIGLAGILYEVGFIATRGATPGKMAVGIVVIKPPSHDPPGWGTGFKRWAINLLGAIPIVGPFAVLIAMAVSFVMLFTDSERRTLWDRVAGTRVVTVR